MENVKTWQRCNLVYTPLCLADCLSQCGVFLKLLGFPLLKAWGCFGGRVLVGFQNDWNIKSCGIYNPGKFLFSNLTRLEDFTLYFIVQHKKNTSRTEMSFIPLPMYLMLYSLRHFLFAKGLFNHCLTISKWEKMLGFIQRKGGAFQSFVFNLC